MLNTVHLILRKKWYDMISSGQKREEYRAITPYWTKRLMVKHYDTVTFHYGYTNRTMTYTIIDITEGIGVPQWGAENERVYIIRLGERIS